MQDTSIDSNVLKPDYLFKLAHWAITSGALNAWEKHFIYDIGLCISRKQKLSEKQQYQTRRIIRIAIDQGYNKGDYNIVSGINGDSDILVLNLSRRSDNALRKKGIHTVKQISLFNEKQLLKIRNFGVKCLNEIKYKAPAEFLPKPAELSIEEPEQKALTIALEKSTIRRIQQQKVPLDKIGVDYLELSPRAHHALLNSQIHTLLQLINLTTDNFSTLANLGIITQNEIIHKLNDFLKRRLALNDWRKYTLNVGDTIRDVARLITKLCWKYEKDNLLGELQVPPVISNHISAITGKNPDTLQDLKGFVRTLTLHMDPVLPLEQGVELVRHMKEIITWLQRILAYRSIDDELDALLDNLTDRERYIFLKRNVVGQHSTLEKIGNYYGVTRERVRQVEEKVKKKIVRRLGMQKTLSLYNSKASIIVLKRMGTNISLKSWKELLKEKDYIRDVASADLLLAICALSSSQPLTIENELLKILKTGISPQVIIIKKAVSPIIHRYQRNCGAIRLPMLVSMGYSRSDIQRVLELEGFSEIYPDWWYKQGTKCVPFRIAKKVVAYCGPVSINIMRHAIRRHLSRGKFPTVPSEVLAKILIGTNDFIIDNGFVNMMTPNNESAITNLELLFIDLVNECGPVVSFELVHKSLTQAGYSRASVSSLLGFSSLVRRVAYGLHTLLGREYDASDIESAKAGITKVPYKSTIKPRSDGVIEFETYVSTWMIYGGVQYAGLATNVKGQWHSHIGNEYLGEIHIHGNFIRNLSDAVDKLGLHAGEKIRMEFNTWSRDVNIVRLTR